MAYTILHGGYPMRRFFSAVLVLVVAIMFISSQGLAAHKKKHHKASTAVETTPPPEPVAPPPPPPEKAKKQKVRVSDYPEKGWHKGPYLAANVGMMQITNDSHIVTGRKFDGSFDPEFGLTFGWDIADWIGPMLQVNFATATDQVGDPNNAAAGVIYPAYPQYTFPAGTFPVENGARQYALDFSIFCRATLPYFTRAEWQSKMVKVIPFAKLGASGHAVFNKAPTSANMAGAFGGGPAVGLGVEFLVWKGFFFALDFTEHLIIQKAVNKTITATDNNTGITAATNFKVTQGGFKPHFSLAGLFGWHF